MQNEYGLEVVNVRLVKEQTLYSDKPVGRPEDAAKVVADEMATLDREVFCVLNLNTKGHVLHLNIVSMGTLNSSMVHPREVFKSVILANAASIILIHNHPSGDITPSPEDRQVTKQLVEAGEILGISVLDHLVVGAQSGDMYSFAQEGELEEIFDELQRERFRDREMER